MVDRDDLVTRDEIVEAAVTAGLGLAARLDRQFISYQGIGLVGKASSRARRRGGEGLWHPVQQWLFVEVMRQRVEGKARVPTLANLPVALWRLGFEGIETRQVQAALAFWGGYLPGAPSGIGEPGRSRGGGTRAERRPRGDRSLRRHAIDNAVELLSSPTAGVTAKRELRKLLEIVNDLGEVPAPDTLAKSLFGVMAVGSEPTSAQRRVARNQHTGMRLSLLAVRHLDQLCASDAAPLWEWARRADQSEWGEYQAEQAAMVGDLETGYLYARPLFDEIYQRACQGLMVVLGIGLGILWGEANMSVPPGEESPPRILITRRH